MRHSNNGHCEKCQEIMNKFPGFSVLLRDWFQRMQSDNPEFHCADAGRGQVEQEIYFRRGSSFAHWGESSHNYNCAIDTFFQIEGKYSLSLDLYIEKIKPNIPDWLEWAYYWPGKKKEIPHFELKVWKMMKEMGAVKLVE